MATFEIPPNAPLPGTPEGAASRASSTEQVEYSPVLLSQLQDELARSRVREAFWISVIVHIVLVLAIALAPKYMPERRAVQVASAEDMLKNKDLTFLELPPDQQPPPVKPPDTKFTSDKNRVATSRAPIPDKKTLDALRDARRPGAPNPPGPPVPQQQAHSSAPNAPSNPSQQQSGPQAGQQASSSNMPAAPVPVKPPPNPFSGAMSAGTAIAEAARSGVRSGYGGAGGEYGLGQGSPAKIRSNMDVLSDTMGVDFGPYLSRVLQSVRMNWYTLIPEVARAPLMKKGKVSIEFAILKDGKVAGMRLVGPSGDVSLDRAAWGGITASSPFSPLPGDFRGPYLALRFHFYYNPEKNELE